ncbi:MAG TPA: dihydropteroate synthase [Crocinitomicaceae bacterium]|nr:dihydropteroate synthase [Crocinitomicaceae bacterium]
MQTDLIHIKGKLYHFDELWIMAILNLSEDSFFEHFSGKSDNSLLTHVENLISNGAKIIDIGSVSTRPNAPKVSSKEEIKKLGSSISTIKKKFPSVLISIDSIAEETHSFAINEGADIINDISGGEISESIISSIVKNKLAYILTYNRGRKENLVKNESTENILSDSLLFFSEKLEFFAQHDLYDIVLDPGFGFNKSLEDNFNLLRYSEFLKILERPMLFGLSRKSMIYKTLEIKVEEALNGTNIFHTYAHLKGANILRVHDIVQAKQLKMLLSKLN